MPKKGSRSRHFVVEGWGFASVAVWLAASSCISPTHDSFDDLERTAAEMELDSTAPNDQPTASVCSASTGTYQCFAHIRAKPTGFAQSFATPSGYGATDLQAAYKIPQNMAGTPTIAIVVAYGYANLEADLSVYREQYGLPPCTVANGCLKIVNQTGQTAPLPGPPPATDDWTLETALDVDMASAACPKCKLLVVQANDNIGNGLLVGQRAAIQGGASVISNSWGGPEQPGNSLAELEPAFDHPGVATFVASGDDGYNHSGSGPDYPATSAFAIGVGGTKLVKDASQRGFTETAWAMGGSACSLSIAKPAYQANTGCNFKATSDIAAVGDPQTGVAVYNSRNGGWVVLGGTSAAAPLVAGIFAALGLGAHASGEFIKANANKLYDVTSGNNGTCSNPILCKAGPGWDGPTGYGTPNASAFVGPLVIISPAHQEVVGSCTASHPPSGFAVAFALAFLLSRRRPIRRR